MVGLFKDLWKRTFDFNLIRSLDAGTVLIALFVLVSTGHVGRMFADREDERQAFVGYVLALSLDGVLAVSLYEVANVRRRSRRAFALCVFLVMCTLSAGFNIAYYRQHSPSDPPLLSVLLGSLAPISAAFLSVLKSMADAERSEDERNERETERQAGLERYRIEQAERTKRLEIEQKERTKRERAKARAAKAIAQAERTASEQGNGHGEHDSERDNGQGNEHSNRRLKPGELDDAARMVLMEKPSIGPRPLARELGCSPSTASGVLKRIRDNGNGTGGSDDAD